MGLSASQTRLLSITARMHDVEYQAQNIMNQKIQLATQQDEAYTDYCEALDAKKIKIGYGSGNNTKYVDATFNNVCNFDRTGNRKCTYAMTEASTGRMVVDTEVYENYQDYSNDKYSFAWAMLGFIENDEFSDFSWSDNWGNNVGYNAGDGDEGADGHCLCLMTDAEEIVYNRHTDDQELTAAYNAYQESLTKDNLQEQKEALQNFRDILYKNNKYKAEIYDIMRLDKTNDRETSLENKKYLKGFPDEFDETLQREFDYYVHIFEGIQKAGGCIDIAKYANGDDYLDNEWFNTQINSGRLILNVYTGNGPNKGWSETSVATSINENFLTEETDEADIKKAEANYEHALNKIKKKDAQYDKDLQKLETERTAIKTEMDSIKKVEKDNVERTFGIFS